MSTSKKHFELTALQASWCGVCDEDWPCRVATEHPERVVPMPRKGQA